MADKEKFKIREIFPDDLRNWVSSCGSEVGIVILRSMMALLWFSQAMIKLVRRDPNMYDDHDAFLGQLNWAMLTHPWNFVSSILNDLIIPNYEIMLVLVLIVEFSIAFSLGLGLFTRLGSLLGMMMGISLWILTLGWDEWFWTYPLIVFPHMLFFLSRSGKMLGVDRALEKSKNSSFLSLLM